MNSRQTPEGSGSRGPEHLGGGADTGSQPSGCDPVATLPLGGLLPISLIDFPGTVAAVLFLVGCNLRCPYCHNGSLVRGGGRAADPDLDVAGFLDFLERRRGRLGGVVVSGGEPTIRAGLARLLRAIRARGMRTKLDTNGTRPVVLEQLLRQGLLDHVALDLKAPPGAWTSVTGVLDGEAAAGESLALLRRAGVPYELRTTVCRDLPTDEELHRLAELPLAGERWWLQPFRPGPDVLRPERGLAPPSRELLHAVVERACARGVLAALR